MLYGLPAILVVMAALSDVKVGTIPGSRESYCVRDMRRRGLGLVIGDGHQHLGSSAQRLSSSAEQRCWNHRHVLDRLPDSRTRKTHAAHPLRPDSKAAQDGVY